MNLERYAAIRADLAGDLVELRLGATSEENPGPLAGKGTGHCTADRTARAVDHGNLVLQQHSQSVLSALTSASVSPGFTWDAGPLLAMPIHFAHIHQEIILSLQQ
jgi:hypothetical protein